MLSLLSTFIIEIIAGAIIVPASIIYIRRLVNYFKSKRFEVRMSKVYAVYEELHRLREYFDSQRVLLLRTTNGGGLPAPGNTLYATIIAEVDAPGNEAANIREEWQHRLIDHEYIRMLEKVYTDGEVINIVSDMPEKAMLRGAYEKIGVTHTRVLKLGVFNNAFYYLSIACPSDKKLSPAKEYTLQTSIQKLKKLLN